MKSRHSRFLQALRGLRNDSETGPLSLEKVVQRVGTDGHFILILFVCLPFLQPIPLPGLSTPFGLLIGLVAFFRWRGKPPWVPISWSRREIPAEIIQRVTEIAEKIWLRVELVVHPRWNSWLNYRIVGLVNFVLLSFHGLLLALPLPIPFSNTVPAVFILLNALGQLEEDGVVVLASYLIVFVTLVFFTGILAGAGVGLRHFLL